MAFVGVLGHGDGDLGEVQHVEFMSMAGHYLAVDAVCFTRGRDDAHSGRGDTRVLGVWPVFWLDSGDRAVLVGRPGAGGGDVAERVEPLVGALEVAREPADLECERAVN